MTFFNNRDLNRLAVHSTMHQLALAISSAFSAVFLLREGLSPAAIFLCIAAILCLAVHIPSRGFLQRPRDRLAINAYHRHVPLWRAKPAAGAGPRDRLRIIGLLRSDRARSGVLLDLLPRDVRRHR